MGCSILKYGSSITRKSDKYSDKDLLIVGDNYEEINSLKQNYSSLGWSVSSYTYSKLHYLSKNGYLFIKHLINEGEIQEDYQDKLKNVFLDFKECLDYNEELNKAANFVNFVNEIPDTTISYSWLCDNIYITFRNYLIYKSAIKKDFKFGYIDLINQLLDENIIDSIEVKLLLELRVIKSCYRNNFEDIVPSKDYLNRVIIIVNRIGLNVNVQFTKNSLDFSKINFNKIKSPYKKLRFLELVLKNEKINDLYLNECISNPQMYATDKSIEKIYKKTLLKLNISHNIILAKYQLNKITTNTK